MSRPLKPAHEQVQAADTQAQLTAYPVDLSAYLNSISLDETGLFPQFHLFGSEPSSISLDALLHWNHYLASGDEQQRQAFLAHACWLVQHAVDIGEAAGWPHAGPVPGRPTSGSWLSALTQGCALSVLTRACVLTEDPTFLHLADRVVRTFEHDILDGGVSAPVGTEGIFFEARAVYPAAHQLSGFLLAILGLYDYLALTGTSPIEHLVARSLRTLHRLLAEFDRGFWTCADLLQRPLSSPAHLGLQAQLLEALASHTHCEHCAAVAARWRLYLHRWPSRLRYCITRRCQMLLGRIQSVLFPRPRRGGACLRPGGREDHEGGGKLRPYAPPTITRACIPVEIFPATGGVFTVLDGLALAMKDKWHIEYLTQCIGPSPERYTIHRFCTRSMVSWTFPFVWLYVLSGTRKLISLMRKRAGYDVLLPQDGVATAGLAGLAGKLTAVRVVCIDHGHLSLFTDRNRRVYYAENMDALAANRHHRPWVVQLLARQLFICYWPSRCLLARIAARFVDHYLIPGVPGDSIEEGCNIIGIPTSRITRFGSMIDINRHVLPDAVSRATLHEQKGLAVDAIVVAIVCRLSREKGLDIALESIHQALSSLPDERRERVRVILAGDGPLRKQIAEIIAQLDLSQYCLLYGELSADEVITLLGISDIFLYTSTRGACIPMSVLEAMASACAVIASTEPLANAVLLADGRGIAVPSGDAVQAGKALTCLLNDVELCHRMGTLARDYIAEHHSPTQFRRTLLRATHWSGLDELLAAEKKDG